MSPASKILSTKRDGLRWAFSNAFDIGRQKHMKTEFTEHAEEGDCKSNGVRRQIMHRMIIGTKIPRIIVGSW